MASNIFIDSVQRGFVPHARIFMAQGREVASYTRYLNCSTGGNDAW